MFAQERMYLQFQSLVILMSFLTKSERGETAFFDSAFFDGEGMGKNAEGHLNHIRC